MTNQWQVMSEYYKEQHPLLCEEVSEEERYSPRYHRRLRPTSYRGRSRNNLKGAASILTRWPDQWSSFLAYWWIGLGMISLMTFLIYNTLFAFAILPTANLKPTGSVIPNPNEKIPPSAIPNVYMHVFGRQYEDIDFNLYMPHIEKLSTKYVNINFHFIVVFNDTNLDWLSAEENNEIALNSLWRKDSSKETTTKSNILIEYVTLSAYMENSPLRKYWKTLPHQLIEFLARAISIWDKGGIVFNPVILTPRSQHSLYTEKLHKLLNKYANITEIDIDFRISNKFTKTPKKDRKLNNIRDIINALENDNSANSFSQQSLTEAENEVSPIVTRGERNLFTATDTTIKNETEKNTEPFHHIQIHPHANAYLSDGNIEEIKHHTVVNSSTESTRVLDNSQNTTKISLLPLFLEFLFHNKLNVKQNPTETTTNRTRKSVIELPKSDDFKSSLSTHSLDKTDRKIADMYKPVIVSAAGIYNTSEYAKDIIEIPSKEIDEKNRLTIDLKGNIIATDTACHAFLGTIFSNAVHHSQEESVTDFIIAELTIFCKGLLSSCMGIDLILL